MALRNCGSLVRVLHIFDHSLPLQSGYVFRSVGILEAQRSFGWETLHLTTARYNVGSPPVETVDDWTFYRTPKPTGPFARLPVAREVLEMGGTRRRIDAIAHEQRPDILHAHSPLLTGIPALKAARAANLPLVYEVRALWEDAAVDLGRAREGGLRYQLTRMLETRLLRGADAIITLCQAMRTELVSRAIPEEKITVVPNAVNLDHFGNAQVRDIALARELGLEGRIVLGFIGSFYHYEGLDLLLKALPAIHERVPNIALLLVGGGPEAEKLAQLTHSGGLDALVRLVGRVPHEAVRRYYDLVDFLIYPRRSIRLTELVTPLKPLEAMAQGRIVLASDVGGHRELIDEGVTGYLFGPDDPTALARQVIQAVCEVEDHEPMREAARRFVAQQRTWQASASRYRAVYEALLADRRS